MKYCLLLLSLLTLLLCGCQSDLYYQEQAVDSARKFIYENARELSPEQYAFVKMTPPVLLTGQILGRSAEFSRKGGEKLQICIAWRIPEADTDYLVFGMSEPRMAFWKPLKLIRRRLGNFDRAAWNAVDQARSYAVNNLNGQLSFADLNRVRFSLPEVVRTSFKLGKEESRAAERPWKKSSRIVKGKGVQTSLAWKISKDRYAVFCGIGQEDLASWQIVMAGVFEEKEFKGAVVKYIKTADNCLTPLKNIKHGAGAERAEPALQQKNK